MVTNKIGHGPMAKFGRNPATVTGDAIQDESTPILIRKNETPVEIISDDTDDDNGGTAIVIFTRDVVGAQAGAASVTPTTTTFSTPATVDETAGDAGKREVVKITIEAAAVNTGSIAVKLSDALTVSGIVTTDGDSAIVVAASIYALAASFVGWTLSPPVGVGALTVKVWGVDEDWNPIEETGILNGTTLVSLLKSFLYVYRAKVITTGTSNVNLGNITIRAAAAGDTLSKILIGLGQTQRAVMPVFSGCKYDLSRFRFEGVRVGTLTGEISLVEYSFNGSTRVIHSISFGNGAHGRVEWAKGHKEIDAKSLLYVKATNMSGSGFVTASFDGDMIRYSDPE